MGTITPISSGKLGTTFQVPGTESLDWLTCPEPGSCLGVASPTTQAVGQTVAAVFSFHYSA